MTRRARLGLHLAVDLVTLIPAALVALAMIALGAPTWAWVVVAFFVWGYLGHKLLDSTMYSLKREALLRGRPFR